MKIDRTEWTNIAIAAVALLCVTFAFGGASRLNEMRLALVHLASLPLLVLALKRLASPGVTRPTRLAALILSGLVLIPLLQLLPLPAALWTRLPGRQEMVLALNLAEVGASWAPLSLTPEKTWRSLLSLMPPIALFLGVLLCRPSVRLRFAQGLLVFATASIILGAIQTAAGSTPVYLWPTTDAGSVTGFFANRNHLATLVLLSLPFASIMAARSLRRGQQQQQLTLWLAILFVGLAIVAIGVIRSRMGVVLVVPVLGASIIAAWVGAGRGRPKPQILAIAAVAAVAVGVICVFALTPLLTRFDSGASEGRFENWPLILEAANQYLPFGSGLGSFDAVFRSVEPLARLDGTFFNQAHNDYLESWLETGWAGAGLVVAFLVWFGRRTWTAWRSPASTEYDLQRAASIAIGVVLIHSAVDYPIRTVTIAVLFAMCCAILELAGIGVRGEIRSGVPSPSAARASSGARARDIPRSGSPPL